jgi:hypothetical protein
MDSKTRTLILSIIVAAILWLLGGFVFNHALGIVCVFIGITIVGLATGSIMDTPEPVHDDKK